MSSTNGSLTAQSPADSALTPSGPFPHSMLSSISSLSSSTASRHPSHISKTYRQASTLFLTRRLPEALTTLLPLITPPESAADEPAPVSRASRTTRVKVWSLYLTVLNAIIELEPDEGKDAFGNQEWRALCTKVRDGEVWEEVVRNGYHGVEGDVDSDVVINLATLLLAHARDQILNQKRLETYLAACNTPNLDITGRLADSYSPGSRVSGRYRSPAKGASGADTPRDLNSRVKILELYTLHVLLRNDEWDYAREFISMSAVLDEERREAFLQALESLKEEQKEQERLAREERERQEDQLRREIEETKKLRQENEERERKRVEDERARRESSELDYGVDQAPSTAESSRTPSTRPQTTTARSPKPATSRSNGKAIGPPTLSARAAMIFTKLRGVLDQLGTSLNQNPMVLVRLLAFVLGVVLMYGHKGVRERVQRVLGTAWTKVRSTAGMGVKVTYI